VIVVAAGAAVVGLVLAWTLRRRTLVVVAGALAAVAVMAGPTAYALTSVTTPVTGALAAAGPAITGAGGGPGGGRAGGNRGGFGAARAADPALVAWLEAHRGSAEYLVAAFGSQSSAPIIIATGQPVVTIGGFNGGDPAPTLAQFQQMVAAGTVRYLLVGGGGAGFGGGAGGGRGGGQAISQWATENGTAVDASAWGGTGASTLYDLSGAA
jgi:hypothetical protein